MEYGLLFLCIPQDKKAYILAPDASKISLLRYHFENYALVVKELPVKVLNSPKTC